MKFDRIQVRFLFYFLAFVALAFTSLDSFGYEDEFWSIDIVDEFSWASFDLIKEVDVHPPGAYVINWALISVLKSWSLVRLLSSVFLMIAVVLFSEKLVKRYGPNVFLVVLIFLLFNPAFYLLCTGIRWYAYFVPLFLLGPWFRQSFKRRDWIYFFVWLAFLGYLNYLVFVIGVPLALYFFSTDKRSIKDKSVDFILGACIFLLLYGVEIKNFYIHHLFDTSGQVGGLQANALSFFTFYFSNQGLFPLSLFGLLGALGFGLMMVFMALNYKRLNYALILTLVAIWIMYFIGGVGVKARNFVAITAFFTLFIVHLFHLEGKLKWLMNVSFILIGIANLAGVYNVIRHEDSIKANWNMPFKEIVAHADSIASRDSNVVILSHDPGISYTLMKKGHKVAGYYHLSSGLENFVPSRILVYHTYYGGMMIEYRQQWDSLVNTMSRNKGKVRTFGHDKYADIKRKKDPQYPDYYCEFTECLNPDSSWKSALTWYNMSPTKQ
jgi:hypothetical protein